MQVSWYFWLHSFLNMLQRVTQPVSVVSKSGAAGSYALSSQQLRTVLSTGMYFPSFVFTDVVVFCIF
jgi:hypothetical protein